MEIESAIWGPELARRACRGTFGRTLVGGRSGRRAEGERRGENVERRKRARSHLGPETYSRISVCTSTAEATIRHFVCALPHLRRGIDRFAGLRGNCACCQGRLNQSGQVHDEVGINAVDSTGSDISGFFTAPQERKLIKVQARKDQDSGPYSLYANARKNRPIRVNIHASGLARVRN